MNGLKKRKSNSPTPPLHTHLKRLITHLSDGKFYTKSELCQILTLTDNEVYHLIQQCPDWDIDLETHPSLGYRIPDGITWLEKDKILPFLTHPSCPILHIELFDALPSTNDYLLNEAKAGRTHPSVCFAEKQTAGRGRQGRTWVSPFAKNIYLSILWHFPKAANTLSGLSLAIALAVIEALKAYGIHQTLQIKWPNDVFWNHQKLGGILTELCREQQHQCSAVIGVGLNIAVPSVMPDPASYPWTGLQSLTGAAIERNRLAGILLNTLLKTITLFQNQGLGAFLTQWKSVDLTLNKPVTLITPTAHFQGIGRGIDEKGLFLMEDENGTITRFSSGKVSIRLR